MSNAAEWWRHVLGDLFPQLEERWLHEAEKTCHDWILAGQRHEIDPYEAAIQASMVVAPFVRNHGDPDHVAAAAVILIHCLGQALDLLDRAPAPATTFTDDTQPIGTSMAPVFTPLPAHAPVLSLLAIPPDSESRNQARILLTTELLRAAALALVSRDASIREWAAGVFTDQRRALEQIGGPLTWAAVGSQTTSAPATFATLPPLEWRQPDSGRDVAV